MKNYSIYCLFMAIILLPTVAKAEPACAVSDKPCVMSQIEMTAQQIEDKKWRDKVYRELAKSYAAENMTDKAIALIAKIETPDTKAMTIRGIGMAAADLKWSDKAQYDTLFATLKGEAVKITHPPSNAIAYTYIAMAQAFAGDDAGAMMTALGMENSALKHKALAETAEIQAERGDLGQALKSIEAIDSVAFKNKAYATVAHIFTKQGQLDNAYKSAMKIENAYKKTEALQDIINHDNK